MLAHFDFSIDDDLLNLFVKHKQNNFIYTYEIDKKTKQFYLLDIENAKKFNLFNFNFKHNLKQFKNLKDAINQLF